ncbi:hypothetical protein [Saccharopolyspora rectivirgula]|uniref:hypothetical protein n=1 Tax=Saccharopolyspora rectivirgula TaxID=28042 RepID=UPI003C6E9D3A
MASKNPVSTALATWAFTSSLVSMPAMFGSSAESTRTMCSQLRTAAWSGLSWRRGQNPQPLPRAAARGLRWTSPIWSATARRCTKDIAVGASPAGRIGRVDDLLIGQSRQQPPRSTIVLHTLTGERQQEVHLYHGVRTRQDLYDQDFFSELQSQVGNFTYTPCLSRETWAGRSGYVTDAFLADFRSCRNYSGYVCGPPRMVEEEVKALKRRRMPPRRIRREKFTSGDHSAAG